MQVAVVSDSHVPSRAAMVPPAFHDRLRAADHVLHAGDFDSPEAYDAIAGIATENGGALTAVRGNTDPYSIDVPRVASVELAGTTFVLTHGDGPAHSYEERVAETVREAAGPDAVGVSGHTHELHDTEVRGVRLLNPGSVTGATPASEATIMIVEPDEGTEGPLDVAVHRL